MSASDNEISLGDEAGVYGPLSLTELRDHAQPASYAPMKGQATLPLERLEPEVFERLCAEVVSHKNDNDVHFYGRRGQKQYGLDIVEFGSARAGRSQAPDTRVYQVKRFSTLTSSNLQDIVDEYLKDGRFSARELVVMTSAPFDSETTLVDALADLREEHADDLGLQVWGLETLCRKLRNMPSTVRATFGRAMALEFSGAEGTPPPVRLHRISNPDSLEQTLRLALKADYEADDQVRFDEADLVGPRVDDMFIDVPVLALPDSNAAHLLRAINPRGGQIEAQHHRFLVTDVASETSPPTIIPPELDPGLSSSGSERDWNAPATAGGAQALLHKSWRGSAILIGGPGQGKTTLTQYVCQFHRARHLGLEAYRPDENQLAGAAEMPRIALRIDLRRYAAWRRAILSDHESRSTTRQEKGRRKKKVVPPSRINDSTWLKQLPPKLLGSISLETYLAEQVSASAGGLTFTVDHLAAVVARWPTLLVFDGLDEVSPIADRVSVSDQIRATRGRLDPCDGAALDVMMLVATRPGIIERPLWHDPAFSVLELGRLDPALKMNYLGKWARAADLSPERVDRLLAMFEVEHDQAHVAEVSSSPMQLAILFDLIDRRSVIPAKRTELYDAYIDTFFNREFEKNDVMRKYRPILLKMHAYLGWTMHKQAEQGESDGTISAADLRERLAGFLADIGQPPKLLDDLFGEVKGRVICLVARSQSSDRLEFEVQSIREYFAAYWLFKEADVRSAGTKDERLTEVIRRSYWNNVARFGAGMFNDGELASIVFACRDLQAAADYKRTSVVRATAKQFLDDHVFSTARASIVQDLVAGMLGGPGVVLARDGLVQVTPGPFALTPGAGCTSAIKLLQDRLSSETHSEVRRASARILLGLATELDERDLVEATTHGRGAISEWWWEVASDLSQVSVTPSSWLETGADLHVLGEMTDEEEVVLESLLRQSDDCTDPVSVVSILSRGGRWAPGPRLSRSVLVDLADGARELHLPPVPTGMPPDEAPGDDDKEAPDEFDLRGMLVSGPLGHAVRACDPTRFYVAAQTLGRTDAGGDQSASETALSSDGRRRRHRGAGAELRRVTSETDRALATFHQAPSEEAWWVLQQAIEDTWGDTWIVRQAALATPTRILATLPTRATSFSSETGHAWRSVVNWLAAAYEARAVASWWTTQARALSTDDVDSQRRRLLLVAAIGLCHSTTLAEIAAELELTVGALDQREWGQVVGAAQRQAIATGRRVRLNNALRGALAPSPRLATIIWAAGDDATKRECGRYILPGMSGLWGATVAADKVLGEVIDADPEKLNLDQLRGARRAVGRGRAARWPQLAKLTVQRANAVLDEPGWWPTDVVRRAAQKLEARANGRETLLAERADACGWEKVP